VTEFDLEHAAVASTSLRFGSGGPSLVLTTFAPQGTDAVWVVRNISDLLNKNGTAYLEKIENDTQWPNQAQATPDGSKVLTACGFFVNKAKSTGSVDLYDVSKFPAVQHTKISEDLDKNFYHQAIFMDVTGDGVEDDIVAARSFKTMSPFAKAEGEMLWFKDNKDGTYETKFLTEAKGLGPGVGFTTADLDGNGLVEFVATQFFTAQQLSVWECTKDSWADCENGNGVNEYVVDNVDDTPFFSVQYVDINGDGKKDLLTTTNTGSGDGAVYAYELVGDFRDGPSAWVRHVLATGYKPLKKFPPGQGSPGTAYSFPRTPTSGKFVPILVSADDGGWFDVLNPTGDWKYTQDRLVTTSGTVGTSSVPMDIDGSGRLVFFVPLYAEGKVQMYVV